MQWYLHNLVDLVTSQRIDERELTSEMLKRQLVVRIPKVPAHRHISPFRL